MTLKLLKLEITGDRALAAVEDPALVALVEKKWRMGPFWFANEQEGEGGATRQWLMLVMTPPSFPAAVPVELPPLVIDLDRHIQQVTQEVAKATDEMSRNIRMAALVSSLGIIMVLCGGFAYLSQALQ